MTGPIYQREATTKARRRSFRAARGSGATDGLRARVDRLDRMAGRPGRAGHRARRVGR